ncbi:hypothetical protein N752_29480 [Desulforamulus aquiferis]|nr:tyrosine-type recombinase/integrase [Desulforamulus aquiferis]RYD01710.1 hypothetical protein N752_29480 [Desulforamulus aquiferis]
MNNYESLDMFIKENDFSDNTKSSYTLSIRSFLNHCNKEISEVTKIDVLNWLAHLKDNLNEESIRLRLYALNSFLKFCQEEGVVNRVSSIGIKVAKVKTHRTLPLTSRSLFIIRDASKSFIRDRTIIEILYSTGIRVSELINIKIKDLYLDINYILITSGKGSSQRYVLFTNECKELINEYLISRKTDSDFLFVNRKNRKMSRQSIYKIIKKYVIQQGLDNKISPHSFRHAFATKLLEKGSPIEITAKLLGHKSYNTTKIYDHTSEKVRKRKYDLYTE